MRPMVLGARPVAIGSAEYAIQVPSGGLVPGALFFHVRLAEMANSLTPLLPYLHTKKKNLAPHC
jgi:hypothetical protein